MSYTKSRRRERGRSLDVDLSPLRLGALLSALLVMASFMTAVYHVVNVVGDPTTLIFVTAGSLLAATVLSWVLSVRSALLVSAGILAAGLIWYLSALPSGNTYAFGAHVDYIIALLAGHSILEIVNLRAWVLATTPAPVFTLWYLALRRRYAAAALIGGLTIGFFVLTGDATFPVAMMGTVGALALVGLGALERADASVTDAEVVSIVLAVVVVVSLTVTFVPQGAAMTYSPDTGFSSAFGYGNGNTLEASLLSANQRLPIGGSIELSPKVRWTVESEQRSYWRVAAYDLYTGDGWVRRAEARRDRGALGPPPSVTRRVEQTFTAESRINTMPAAWRPTDVDGQFGSNALVTDFGGLQPSRPLQRGESYSVESALSAPSGGQLQQAGTDYPDRIERLFTQLPDSTPDRVTQRTDTLTSLATTPYEKAVIIENWLEENREYSLEVDRPSGNIADKFLFEMEAGYCTYFATTMIVMLRTQGIPARMAVGYTPGERVSEDEWVVRGYNSHAWVEAYFPEVGWVRFDPTPASERGQAESERLEEARENDESDVDIDATQNSTYSAPTIANPGAGGPPSVGPNDPGETNGTTDNTTDVGPTAAPSVTDVGGGTGGGSAGGPQLPSRENVVLGAIAMFGLVATARRSGVSGRLYRAIWLRWQPRVDPESDVQRAYERLETVLEREHRPRAPGETARQYLDSIGADQRAREVASIHERARYAGEVDEAAADRAVTLVDAVVAES